VVEALRDAFTATIEAPVRHHHAIPRAGEAAATLLLMPAWHAGEASTGGRIGVKIVSVFPGNAQRGKPSVVGSYLLFSGLTGEALAVLDGSALTLWRTAAASALAAGYLARSDSRSMVMVGAGALAPYLIAAHASVRPIDRVAIWNRDPARANRLAATLGGRDFNGRHIRFEAATNLADALAGADIVSAATLADQPLIHGTDLPAGIHVDLVGAFTPAMREADDEAVRRAEVFVDTRAGALAEAGDIVQPVAAGVIAATDIRGDLSELCRGDIPGRTDRRSITLFKSVGTALEDLAAASLVYDRVTA
jgi:ornithine cyclodeaminase/alanine dehydrogenase-like protein (mu-crystallin family)